MLAHAPEFRIVQQQVRKLAALLHQMNIGKPGDPLPKALDAEQLAQDHPRIVKTQRLIEIANQKICFGIRPMLVFHMD